MLLDDALADDESQARASRLAGRGGVDLRELQEQLGQVLGCDALTEVAHVVTEPTKI